MIKYHLIEAYRKRGDLPLTHPRVVAARPRVPRRHPRRVRCTTCSSGATRSSASSPTRRSPSAVNTPPQTHPRPAARRVHQAGQGTQARLHGRLGAPEAQRPGAAHRALQGPVQIARRTRRALDRQPVGAAVPSFKTGTVERLLEERPGLQRVEVDLATAPSARVRAHAADRARRRRRAVVVNTTAVELGLGTGGWHVVHWNLDRDASGRNPGPATS